MGATVHIRSLRRQKMKTLRRILLLCVFFLICFKVHAESPTGNENLWRLSGDWRLCSKNSFSMNIWGISHHQAAKSEGTRDEFLPGFGLRWNCSEYIFVEGNVIERNRVEGKATIASVGLQFTVFSVGPLGFGGGIMRSKTSYEIPKADYVLTSPRTIPFVGVRYKNLFTLNMTKGPEKKTKTLWVNVGEW